VLPWRAKVQTGLRPVQRCKSERYRFRWRVAASGGRWRGRALLALLSVGGLVQARCVAKTLMYTHCNYTMSEPLQVRISRDGKELGTYPSEEVVRLRLNGILKETDLYFHKGMTEWAPLSQLDSSEGLSLPAEPEVKRQSNISLLACGLFIFLLFGGVSACFYRQAPIGNSGGDMSMGGAYCCGAISLLGLWNVIVWVLIKK